MTPEEQRIAIAEVCGWKHETWNTRTDGECSGWIAPSGGCLQNAPDCFPDYLNDLNAMHEAEKHLTTKQRKSYVLQLRQIIPKVHKWNATADCFRFEIINATAAQRAEAFLGTIVRWKE